MNNILLIFLNNLKDLNCFDSIISDFEAEDYKLYLYDEVNRDSFSYTDLPEIIKYYQNENNGLNKVVVLSNIRDLIYFWFRCYNQIVDDYIYIVEEEESNFFDVDDIYFNAYYNIFEFNKIEKEIIEGKIYLTNKCNTILPLFYESKYFLPYQYFNFHRNSNKLYINKTYELEKYIFDFNVFETKNREVIRIDKINKRIVFFKGQSSYDVLRILIDYNTNFLSELGFNIDVVDFLEDDITTINEKLINKKAEFFFALNCIGINLTIFDGRNLFDAVDTPFLGNLGDHPVNHYSRISISPKKTLFTCLDSENIHYMQKYFPDKEVITNFALAYKSFNYFEKSFLDREIDLIFVGTLKEPGSIKETWNSYNPIYVTILNEVSEKILKSNEVLDIDHELEQYTYQYKFEDNVRIFLHSSIERYIRIYKRYHLVKKLGDSNLKVVCIGNKDVYDKLNVSGNLLVYDNIGFQKLLDLFNNCKLLINMTGHLYNGVTERILSAMINGAAVATERDMFTSANFINNENIILYDFHRLDELINNIKYYLNNEEKLEEVALNGQRVAKNYDFRLAAAKYPRIMRNYDKNFNNK